MQEMLIGNEWIDHTVMEIYNILQLMFGDFKSCFFLSGKNSYVSREIEISEQNHVQNRTI